ncbi:cysteine-rich RLK (RECEPTOR-like protein kinase) 8 [Hibiscus trionum]|uniref:Cysteine-rich RLK (RECEPTOR-like protein kinase) 8 n=1 Tax=Hibiscus trionum TaxID=183268 RepID=A0A9W7LPL7_HIBTR|nr:cysteine-rich RLK (RECEPTOR-like protein kinase) 8 [Hibiscus trionum]
MLDGIVIYLLVYVDDIIITGCDCTDVQAVIDDLHKRFSLKDLGKLSFFLGIEVTYGEDCLVLNQKKYIKDLLQRSGLAKAKALPTPMISNLHLSVTSGSPIDDVTLYRSVVGAL